MQSLLRLFLHFRSSSNTSAVVVRMGAPVRPVHPSHIPQTPCRGAPCGRPPHRPTVPPPRGASPSRHPLTTAVPPLVGAQAPSAQKPASIQRRQHGPRALPPRVPPTPPIPRKPPVGASLVGALPVGLPYARTRRLPVPPPSDHRPLTPAVPPLVGAQAPPRGSVTPYPQSCRPTRRNAHETAHSPSTPRQTLANPHSSPTHHSPWPQFASLRGSPPFSTSNHSPTLVNTRKHSQTLTNTREHSQTLTNTREHS